MLSWPIPMEGAGAGQLTRVKVRRPRAAKISHLYGLLHLGSLDHDSV